MTSSRHVRDIFWHDLTVARSRVILAGFAYIAACIVSLVHGGVEGRYALLADLSSVIGRYSLDESTSPRFRILAFELLPSNRSKLWG